MHRQKFGEFYFRTVALEYFPAEQRKKTIASLAVLLEPSHYNLVDVDSVWGGLAVNVKEFGTFGHFSPEDFITSGISSNTIKHIVKIWYYSCYFRCSIL